MLNEEMIASYQVVINGFAETRKNLAGLDAAIARLRAADYSGGSGAHRTVTSATAAGSKGIFVTRVDQLEGRVKSGTQRAMAKSMALGRRTQGQALRAAVTPTGLSGKPAGRNSAGRDVTGGMINAIRTNVETANAGRASMVTGWHGWPGDDSYYGFQERGTKGRGGNRPGPRKIGSSYRAQTKVRKGGGIKPANSLGSSIITVREFLKSELRSLK